MKIKTGIFALLIIISSNLFSQDGSPSPYSYFGLGDTSFKGPVETLSMGGISSYIDSIHYNLNSPASISRLKYITLSMGLSNRFISMEDVNDKVNVSAHNLSYFALGIPIGKKAGLGFGLIPETSTNYKILKEEETGIYTFEGSGGLSRFFLAGSYNLNKNISLGVEFQHHFGYLRKENVWIPESSSTYTHENNNEDLSGSTFKISGLFSYPLKNDKYISANIDYQFSKDLQADYTGSIRLIRITPSGMEMVVSQVDKESMEGSVPLPAVLNTGMGIGKRNKWYAGAGLTYINLKDFKNSFMDPGYISYNDAYTFHLGGMYQPEYNSITSYWKKIVFRGGAYYKQTGMNIYGKDITDFGITFGLGLPGLKGVSNLNLGMELGTRGTTENNLVKENYFNLHISFSLNDVWFVKRKIN